VGWAEKRKRGGDHAVMAEKRKRKKQL